jgi:hypothetical protein
MANVLRHLWHCRDKRDLHDCDIRHLVQDDLKISQKAKRETLYFFTLFIYMTIPLQASKLGPSQNKAFLFQTPRLLKD